jgi:hypothetical protein
MYILRILVILLFLDLFLDFRCCGAEVSLEWDSPPESNVVGYNVYYGVDSLSYTEVIAVGLANQVRLSNLEDSITYYFAVTSVDLSGLESPFSEELTFAPSGSCLIGLLNLSQVYDGTPKPVAVTTTPRDVAVQVTYNGQSVPPTDAGTYEVIGRVADPNYVGDITNILVIAKAQIPIEFSNLSQVYDGTPKSVDVSIPFPGALKVTYDGQFVSPTDAGNYRVDVTVDADDFTGSGTETLSIAKANASVFLKNLDQIYDGAPKTVAVTTSPEDLNTVVTYDANSQPPSAAGTYTVVAIIDDPNYQGSATSSLTIDPQTRHIRQSVTVNAATPPSTVPPTPASFTLSWLGAVNSVTVWQSSDLSSWSPLTNVFGPTDSLLVTPNPKSIFYRATSQDVGGTNWLKLWLRKL